MPSFTIKHPTTGKSLTIQGDTMPTEQELDEIFAQTGDAAPQQQAASIPTPPQGKTLGGFAGNVVKSGANFASNTIEGLWDMGRGALGMINDPMSIPGKIKAGVSAIPEVASGIKNYASERYGSLDKLGDTLYKDPVGALADVSSLTGLGGAAKVPGMAKISRLTNPATPITSTARKVTGAASNRVADRYSRRGGEQGIRARNETFVGRTVNPTGATPDAGAVKYATADYKQSAFRAREAEFDAHLGPEGGYAPAPVVPTPPNLVGIAEGSKAPSYTNMRGKPQPFESTDTPLARSRQVFNDQRELRRPSKPGSPDLVVEYDTVETGPTFRQMHNEASKLRGGERKAMQQNMREAADYAGLSKEAEAYFVTSKGWAKDRHRLDNKFIRTILDTPDEAIPALFQKEKLPTYRRSKNKSIYSGRTETTYSNAELLQQLEGIAGPENMNKLRASIGEQIKARITDGTGKIKPQTLKAQLDKLTRAGTADILLPQHQTLRDIVEVLTEQATTAKAPSNFGRNLTTTVAAGTAGTLGYKLGGPVTAGVAASVTSALVHKLLAPSGVKPRDLERMVKQLQRSRDPKSQRIAEILNKAGLVAGQTETLQDEYIPEPPQR